MCDEINAEVLKGLTGEQYSIVAEDSVDCSASLLQKVKQRLAKFSEDSTQTAGLENVIVIKIGCKVMLRRNIDITMGLVNGAIGTIHSVQRCIDQPSKLDTITIMFNNNQQHCLKRVTTKFEVLDKAYVIRSQFPISTAYAITIHKSQGLTLNHVLTDIGNSIFTCGQAYVALSRVKSISGLHLINFDPRSIKALDSAILEYNRLRQEFRSGLLPFTLPKQRPKSIGDRQWCTIRSASEAQHPVNQSVQHVAFTGKVFVNPDGVSSYANSVMQCLLLSPAVRQAMLQSASKALKDMCALYRSAADCNLDCLTLRQELGAPYDAPNNQNPAVFLEALLHHSSQLSSVLQHTVRLRTQCTHCNSDTHIDHLQHIVLLSIPTSVKSLKLAELMQNYYDCAQSINQLCHTCNHPVKMRREIVNATHVLVLQMEVWSTVGSKVLKRKTNITSIPDSSITVGSSTYTLMSAVSLSSSNKAGCHYMAILSIKGKWMHFKGVSPSAAPWPRGGKDVLLLFYHIKSTVASTKTAPAKDIGRRKFSDSTREQPHTIFARTQQTRMTAGTTTARTCTRTTESSSVTTASTTSSTKLTTHTETTTSAIDLSSPNTSLIFIYCKGFSNNDGVSCYANSILQCLLQHSFVRNAWEGSRYPAFRNLANDYIDPTKLGLLSCRSVRKLL